MSIRLQDSTPQVYYQQSRDFQFIGRLYDIILNAIKTDSDNLVNIPIGKNMDERLLNLLSLTLGFQSKHAYNSRQLAAICSVLPTVMRQKGSINAIKTAVDSLLSAEAITQNLDYSITPKSHITLYLPEELSDLSLLRDLIPYILPAGFGCEMVKEINTTINAETILGTIDEVTILKKPGIDGELPGEIGRIVPVQNTEALRRMASSKTYHTEETDEATHTRANVGALPHTIITDEVSRLPIYVVITWHTGIENKDTQVAYNTVPAYKYKLEKEGYTFLGWSATEGGEVISELPPATTDTEYFAVFEENQ